MIFMKSILKNILVSILGFQVSRLRRRHDFKIVGVVGSIGKTSTKIAIAKILGSEKRVRYQEGNYNDVVSVPLVFFGHDMPSLWNVFSWLAIILQNETAIFSYYPFDFVVLELGTDKPGDIEKFRKYLRLDALVLTAVTSEHMEFFETIGAVADEEWQASFFSDVVFANKDLVRIVPENVDHKKIIFYGKDFGCVYKIENEKRAGYKINAEISYKGGKMIEASVEAASPVALYSVCAASAVARHFGISPSKMKEAISSLKAFQGRMQILKGKKDLVIIDDSYNSSPEALKIALDALYEFPGKKKAAILGMMNELGKTSKEEHEKAGKYCDPKKLEFVITIGKDADEYLAKAAEEKGNKVFRAKSSVEAGKIAQENLEEGMVILVKGSQNGVFAEEAIKPLLAEPSDSSKLVRQSDEWMRKKI